MSALGESTPEAAADARRKRFKAILDLVHSAASLNSAAAYRLRDILGILSDDTQRGTLDALIEMVHFKDSIPSVTAKPKKGTLKKVVADVGGKSRASQRETTAERSERTRNPGVGNDLCTYCESPSERFDAYHGFDIDNIHVVSERERPSVKPTAGELSAEVCARHKGGGSNSLRRTAVNNLDQMRCERAAFSEIADEAGAINHRSVRIRRKVGFVRGQPSLEHKERRYMARRWKLASPILQQFLNKLLAPLSLNVTVTESLARIEISADGYLVGTDADGHQAILHDVCSDDEAKRWRTAFGLCLSYLKDYMDLDNITEEAWLTTTDPEDNNAPIPNAPIPLASIAMFRPEWHAPADIIPRVGFAYRNVPRAPEKLFGRYTVLLPSAPLTPPPGPVIDISLLPPQWLRMMYDVPRRPKPEPKPKPTPNPKKQPKESGESSP
ncbi:MAG: hypothetical protein U1C54_14515 [Xanthomonadaceae bacterium]|nr:hypothetical protein [Xanthomonadaceae bacterium]